MNYWLRRREQRRLDEAYSRWINVNGGYVRIAELLTDAQNLNHRKYTLDELAKLWGLSRADLGA